MNIEISEITFKRLQRLAKPLVDTTDTIITRLLDAYDHSQQPKTSVMLHSETSTDSERDLWESVIVTLPREFSLDDVYRNEKAFAERRPHVQEIRAAIRAILQGLRDKNYIEFIDNQGNYRRLK